MPANLPAITVAAFIIAGVFLGIAGWFIHRNLRPNVIGHFKSGHVILLFSQER